MTDDQTPRYSIIFDGELVSGTSRKAVLENLIRLTNLSADELLDSLFSVRPVVVTQTNDAQLAEKYERQFHLAGLVVSAQPYKSSHDDIVNADLNFGHYAPLEKQLSEPNFIVETNEATASESIIQKPTGKYRVTFNGQLLKGYSRDQVIENISSLTNSSQQEVLDHIFSAIPVIICQTDDMDLAHAYHQGFDEAGLKVYLSTDELVPSSEIDARSYLLIRDDKPAVSPEKKVQRFTYTLYGLAGLAFVCWVLIYLVIDSYLKNDVEPTIQVQLIAQPVIKKVEPKKAQKKVEPAKKPAAAKKKPAPEKTPQPAKVQQKEVKAVPPPEPEKIAAKEPEKPKKKKKSKKLQKLEGKYNLQLLTWFAQFQQQNPLQSKYVEGEITLRITISRDGEIKNIKVLKSTSEELQRIVVMKFRKAKSIPGVPKQITGKEYSFDLPLRYSFK